MRTGGSPLRPAAAEAFRVDGVRPGQLCGVQYQEDVDAGGQHQESGGRGWVMELKQIYTDYYGEQPFSGEQT